MDAKETIAKEHVKATGNNGYHPPIEITVRGRGEEGKKEAELFMKTLSQFRRYGEVKRNGENGELSLTVNAAREKRVEKKPDKKTDRYETSEGSILTITPDNKGGYEATLEENLAGGDTIEGLGYLVKRLESMADVGNIDIEYARGKNGGSNEKLVATFSLSNIREITSEKEDLIREIYLYRNLQRTCNNRLKEIQNNPKDMERFPLRGTLDYIEYWTHLTPVRPARRIVAVSEYIDARIKLIGLADFLRELYGHIEIKTRAKHKKNYKKNAIVTREKILSESKNRSVARERHIMMYIIRKKFDYLSASQVATIFGPIGEAKNHATIFCNERSDQFDESVGFRPEEYVRKQSVKRLYADAEKKWGKAHRKN